jgi:MFS family permease
MAQRREIGDIYAAGMIQGVALVTFPATSSIFTSPSYYGLSSTAYGSMFLPQAVTAIAGSLLSGGLTRRTGIKRTYIVGLCADLVAMLMLVLSRFVMTNTALAYGMLLVATASLGLGFGLTVPSLNTYAAAFFPQTIDRAVLMLNALLGLGTALAPVFVAAFVGLGVWWGLPLLVAVLLMALLASSLPLPLQAEATQQATGPGQRKPAMPSRFWIFAGFALLYGICETMNGNWETLYMTKTLAATATVASLGLTAFWGMVTVGRVLFASIEHQFPPRRTYRILPLVVAAAFIVTAVLPAGSASLGILTFALAGLGCSALLPLTISFGQEELTAIAATVTGFLIAFYQLGYGLAAFGVGPLEARVGISMRAIFGATALIALAMEALAVVLMRQAAPVLNPAQEPA